MNPPSDRPSQTTAPGWRCSCDWLLGFLLVAAVVAAYWPVNRAGFIWDDGLYITRNPLLSAPDGLRLIWFSFQSPSQYFPMVYTVFRFEHALWGVNPVGYHWVNVIGHAANALLLWRLLRKLNAPGAWLAAALFALHPVEVGSVAWASELKNVMSLFFCLLALLAWDNHLDGRAGWFRRWDWLALACYLLALFSKTTACTLPAALLLLCWLKGMEINGQQILEMVPFVLAGLALGFVSVWWEANLMGTTGAIFKVGWLTRLLIASHAIWFYLGKLFWPVHLLAVYPRWNINPSDPLAYGWLAACVATGCAIYCMHRRSVTVAALFYVAMLFPMLGFFMLYTFRYTYVADHWQYMASIGPLALAAAGVAMLCSKAPGWVRPVVYGPLLLGLGILTFRQTGIYANSETLWSATLAGNPQCSIAHLNLGLALAQRGDVERAESHYEKAIEIDPDFAEAYENLGVLELRTGNLDQAQEHLQRFLELYPGFSDAYGNLGTVWQQKGHLDLAASFFKWSLEISPEDSSTHFNLGNVRQQQGRTQEAVTEYRRAVELDPANVNAWNNLGGLLMGAGQMDEAATCLEKVTELNPESYQAHLNLGTALQKQGKEDAALSEYSRAAELDPNSFQVWNNLAWLLTNTRQPSLRNGPKAVEFALRADQLSGGSNVTVLINLAGAYAGMADYKQAAAAARRAAATASAQGDNILAGQLNKQSELYDTEAK